MSHTCDEACTCDCEWCERTRPHDDEPMPERTNTMTDHLTEARKCVNSASQAIDAGSTIAWLTDTCMQIISHLESQEGIL